MRTRLSAIVAAALLTASPLFSAYAADLTTESVRTSLKIDGSKVTLAKFFPCEAYQDTGYEKIASGDREWIQMARTLLDLSDACYTTGLLSALGEAMRKSPSDVLRLIGSTPVITADGACLPFISDELPVEQQIMEVQRSKQSIEKVVDKEVAAQREMCLDFIEQVEKGISGMPQETAR